MTDSSPLALISAGGLLKAIAGIAYLVDGEGIIMGISDEAAAPENQPGECAVCLPYVGRSIFAMLHGEDVKASYQTLHQAVWSGKSAKYGFDYRCDAPDLERRMRMSVSLVSEGGEPLAVLYQSLVLSEEPRAPIPLFRADHLASRNSVRPDDEILTLCSYCHAIAWPIGADPETREWIEPPEYYRRGGASDVVDSHGICDCCFERVVEPPLRLLYNDLELEDAVAD